jgi:catechol-2,3-dioxygenase
MKNPHIRGLGEVVLRVKNLEVMKDFYVRILGLELMKEFEGIAFFKIAEGYGGHTQILGMFLESHPLPVPEPARTAVNHLTTSLHHFAFEIEKAQHEKELTRLTRLGLSITTAVHRWCHWRSIYLLDPEENVVELVCYDEAVA